MASTGFGHEQSRLPRLHCMQHGRTQQDHAVCAPSVSGSCFRAPSEARHVPSLLAGAVSAESSFCEANVRVALGTDVRVGSTTKPFNSLSNT
eukprot:1552634-Prymnesium_polylepis.2